MHITGPLSDTKIQRHCRVSAPLKRSAARVFGRRKNKRNTRAYDFVTADAPLLPSTRSHRDERIASTRRPCAFWRPVHSAPPQSEPSCTRGALCGRFGKLLRSAVTWHLDAKFGSKILSKYNLIFELRACRSVTYALSLPHLPAALPEAGNTILPASDIRSHEASAV